MTNGKIKTLIHKFKVDKNYQLSLVASILILGAAFVWFGVYYNVSHRLNEIKVAVISDENNNNNINQSPEEQLVARRTDGWLVKPEEANRPVVAVMIENLASEGVRPQYGLSKAEIVYELITEGGITRFMAIYSSAENISQIGPVRSARPTYLEFSSEYDALYSHAGGSPEAMAAIDGLKISDCSALGNDSRYFWRDNSRYAPHNLFTSSELLNYALRDKNLLNSESSYDSWQFQDEQKNNSNLSEDKFIRLNFSTPEYQVTWKYDKNSNNYQRYYGEAEHKDALTDDVIIAKNIIVEIVPPAIDAGEKGRVKFDVNGEGKVYIFRDGEKIEGTWRKDSRVSRTKFYDENNQEILLNRGNIWVEILPSDKTFENN